MNSYSIIKDKCKGCTLCARTCPMGAISGALKEPHTIDPDKCVRCGACGRVCTRNAVLDEKGGEAQRVPKDQWTKPHIYRSVCAGCRACVEACPKGCLSITEPGYHGDIRTVAALTEPDACLGCGICAETCPVEAIAMVKTGENPPPYKEKRSDIMGTVNKIWCRTFQAVMKVANYFLGYRMPEYIDGPGSIKHLDEFMKAKGAKKVLVVTDPGLVKLGLHEGMLEGFRESGISI